MITMTCNGPPLCTTSVCGDNFHNAEAGEDCDSGSNDTAGCNGNNHGQPNPGQPDPANCKVPACGDGYVNMLFKPPGSKLTEKCDTKGDSDTCNGDGNGSNANNADAKCQPAQCGDGYVNTMFKPPGGNAPESCDNKNGGNTAECNGNNNGNNGSGSCQIPSCGDGYKNTAFTPPGTLAKPEQCDTGGNSQLCNGNDNDDNNNKGRGDCQIPICGDGYVNTAFTPQGSTLTEQCDNTGGMDTSGCNGNNGGNNGPGSCRFNMCGDGYKNTAAGEQCDPGDPQNQVPEIKCSLASQQCNKMNCHCI